MTNFFVKDKTKFRTYILKPKNDLSKYRYTLDYPEDLTIIKFIYTTIIESKIFGTTEQITNIIKRYNSEQ